MSINKQTLFQKLVNQRTIDAQMSPNTLRYSIKFKLLILIGTVIVCSMFFIIHLDQKIDDPNNLSILPGYAWTTQTLKADFTYPVYKPNTDYKNEVSIAADNVQPVFVLDANLEKISADKIAGVLYQIKDSPNSANLDFLNDRVKKYFSDMNPNNRQTEIEKIDRVSRNFLRNIYKNGFIDINLNKIRTSEINIRIVPNKEYYLNKAFVKDRGALADAVQKFASDDLNSTSTGLTADLITKFAQPNLIYNDNMTEQERVLSEKSVPKTLGIVRKGEVIIHKGDLITSDLIPKIKSYQASRQYRGETSYSLLGMLGSFGHAVIIFSMLVLYLFFIRKRIFYDNFQMLILSLLMVAVSFLAWLSIEIPSTFPLEYLVILPALSMLSAIVFDSRTAFYVTVTMSLFLAGIRGNDYGVGTAMMFAGILAAYTVKDIQSRTQMFLSIFYIFIGLSIAILMLGFERSVEFNLLSKRVIFAAVNAVTAPLFTFGILFVLERTTNIATDLRIKEYDNLNHPLLVKMNEIAPGTYQHTLGVAILAERCAMIIDANPLLTKVGAYFHDIGKIAKAEYFTENQMEMGNKHDMLTPKKSASAIREHVLDGIQLAKQYKLPSRIQDFIPMHHGTTLIKHFYAKALEEAGDDISSVKESDYRYPGPKPNTKETAILMICDSAEAISRLADKSREEIEKIIEENIKERILDGQFDECNITLAELQKVKEAVVKNLLGKSHQRVSYKEIPKQKE